MDVMQLRRNLLMQKIGSGGLPAEYQQVDCIMIPNSGQRYNSYILTGIPYTNVQRIVCKYEVVKYPVEYTQSPMFIASYTSSSNSPDAPFATIHAINGFESVSPIKTPPYEGILDTYTIVTNESNKMIRIGGWSDNYWTAAGKYYFVEVYGSSGLIAKFIPCCRKSDNKAGMYEIVSGIFFPSNGTVDFVAGTNV